MQQFGPQFITDHLMPLLEQMLKDTVTLQKPYLFNLFKSGIFDKTQKDDLIATYFNEEKTKTGAPFAGKEAEEDREKFLQYFAEYIRDRAGSNPQNRIRAFLPVIDEKSVGPGKEPQVIWPLDVKRNLFLMSYNIAQKFEKTQIEELIKAKQAQGKTEEAKTDHELLDQGMLTLVKDAVTGKYSKYINALELKSDGTATEFLPAPTDELTKIMYAGFTIPLPQMREVIGKGASSPQTVAKAAQYAPQPTNQISDKISSPQELTKNFQQKRALAIADHFQELGFEVLTETQVDAHGSVALKIKSGDDPLLIHTFIPANQISNRNLKLDFTFQNGPLAGKSLTIEEIKLNEGFKKDDKTMRTAQELYNDLALCQKLGIKSDATLVQAHQIQALQNIQKPLQPTQSQQLPPSKTSQNLGGEVQARIRLPGQLEKHQPQENQQPFSLPENIKAKEQARNLQPQAFQSGLFGPQGKKVSAAQTAGNGQTTPNAQSAPKPKPLPGIPQGSVMETKNRLKQKLEQTEASQDQLQTQLTKNQGLPIIPGRIGSGIQLTESAPFTANLPRPQKNNALKIVAIANAAGLGFAGGTTWFVAGSQNSQSTSTAFNIIHNAWIALAHFLPRLFG